MAGYKGSAVVRRAASNGAQGPAGPQGVPGTAGANGVTTYTWIKYADTSAGSGLSNDPTGKLYIGFAYNKTIATESTTPGDYTWSLIKGDTGNQGVQGPAGANGTTTYTWIKYSDVADGTGLYDNPTANTLYIGIAVNKTTATESAVKTDYVWSKFKGEQGPTGPLLVPRGAYDSTAIYYGNPSRIDAVIYGGIFYRTKTTAGSFQEVAPTNTSYWELFDQQIDFLATKIFLSEAAFVHNLIAEQLKTAIDGARIEINAGDKQQIAVYDENGNLKLFQHPGPISSLATIQAGASTASFSPTSSEMGSQHRNWSHPNFGTWQGTQVSAQFETTIDGVLEIEISNIRVSAYVYEGSYALGMATITVVLQKYNGSVWVDVGTIGETNETVGTRNISATIRGLSAGIYRLAALHSHMSYTEWQGYEQISDSVQTSSDWSYQSGSSITVTVRKVIAQTEIGTDGIASVWASNVYMHFSQNGLFVKMGTITFEVTTAGVKINGVIHN